MWSMYDIISYLSIFLQQIQVRYQPLALHNLRNYGI